MRQLIKDSPSKEYFESNYETLVKNYNVLVGRLGVDCPNAKLILKMIWIDEEGKRGQAFYDSINTNNWPSNG
jgi:hypothetical protein